MPRVWGRGRGNSAAFFLAPSSSGKDGWFSAIKQEFDSPRGYHGGFNGLRQAGATRFCVSGAAPFRRTKCETAAGVAMPNGKPGDHPLNDIIVHGREVCTAPRRDEAIRRLAGVTDNAGAARVVVGRDRLGRGPEVVLRKAGAYYDALRAGQAEGKAWRRRGPRRRVSEVSSKTRPLSTAKSAPFNCGGFASARTLGPTEASPIIERVRCGRAP